MDRIFIADGPVWTSAGMAAGIDLALGLIERDMGQDIARATARTMVVYHRRAGGQSQHSAMLELDAKSDRVQMALAYARQNLHEPLSLGKLAEVARLSPRQFTRVFRAETRESPAKAIENLRLEAARLMLEQGRLSAEEIARATGSAIASGCAVASCAPSDKHRKTYATLRTRLLFFKPVSSRVSVSQRSS
jgi:transcriptional regulator GlxA family with amidase domain